MSANADLTSGLKTSLITRERRPKGSVLPLLPHHQSFGAARDESLLSAASTLLQNNVLPNLASGGTKGLPFFSPSAVEWNSCHHSPTLRYIAWPPVSRRHLYLLQCLPCSISTSKGVNSDYKSAEIGNANQFLGNPRYKEAPADNPSPFNFKALLSTKSEYRSLRWAVNPDQEG